MSLRSRLSALLLGLALSAPMLAQQVVCLSVHGGPATGTNSAGGPAQLAARVEGQQVSIPTAAGQGAAAASAAHEAAFVAAGFTTMRTGPNEFCVTAAPGGAPITRGLCYGTDDMGLDLDSKVHVPPAAPGGGAAVAKANGVAVPLPPAQQPPQPFGGVITIWIWVRSGQSQIMICVQITLPPGVPGQGLRQIIQQQLLAQGFLGNVIVVPHPWLANQRIEVLQLERMTNGDAIEGIEFQYDSLSRRIVSNVTGAGLESIYGAYEFGRATQGLAGTMPWSRLGGPPPMINSFFDVFHDIGLPLAIGGFVLGTGKTAVPVFNGMLLVDPATMVVELGLTSATGQLARHWQLPNSMALVGFPLHSQGFAFTGGLISMSTGVVANIGP